MCSEEEQDDALKRRLRVNGIAKTFYKMADGWADAERAACNLNEDILRMVVNSYFIDMDRKKRFHGIKWADAHKRAGYMVKWIMRFRPVQIIGDATKRVFLANEALSIAHALKMLEISPLRLSRSVKEHLLYMLRYRTIDPNGLAMSFCLLQEAQAPIGHQH